VAEDDRLAIMYCSNLACQICGWESHSVAVTLVMVEPIA